MYHYIHSDLSSIIEHYRWVFSLLYPYRYVYTIATLAGIISAFATMMVPHYMTKWINTQISNHTTSTNEPNLSYDFIYYVLVWHVVSCIFAGIRGGLYTYLNNVTYIHIYKTLLHTVMGISMTEWETKVSTTELNRTMISYISDVAHHTGLSINVFYRSLSTICTITYFLYPLSASLYMTNILFSFLHILIIHRINKFQEVRSNDTRKTKNEIDSQSQEFVNNYQAMRFYQTQHNYKYRSESTLTNLYTVSYYEGSSYSLYLFTVAIVPKFFEIMYLFILFRSGYHSQFWECFNYYHTISDMINILKDVLLNFIRNKDAITTLRKYMSMDKSIMNKIPLHIQKGTSIEFCDLTFAYPSKPDAIILDKFNETISIGEKVALIAESGAGKSTLIKLIMGFYDDYIFGDIQYNGYSLRKYSIADHISVVPQESVYFPEKTIRENLLLQQSVNSIEDCNIQDVLRRVKLEHLIDDLDKTQANLSGGQKQRISIARVLLSNRPIVILDEPSSSLDKDTEKVVLAELSEFFKEKTVILITHHHDIIGDNFRHIHLQKRL
jgi:ABC-type multidrug transport system fused ATPase/permease subunit